MKDTLHVTAVATDSYVGFVPLFLHYLFEVYPHYYATIFVRDMPDNVWNALYRHKYAKRFDIVDGEFDGYPNDEHGDRTALKFLLFTTDRVKKYFYDTKYCYQTDIDMMIHAEKRGILEQHVEHCETLGLPYSNAIRPNVPPTVMGLNFMTAEYIERIQPVSDVWNAKFRKYGISLIPKPQRCIGERVLYEIINDSGIGLPPHPDTVENKQSSSRLQLFRPWHAVNVGFARHPELLGRTAGNQGRWAIINSMRHDEYFELLPQWGKKAWKVMDDVWGPK